MEQFDRKLGVHSSIEAEAGPQGPGKAFRPFFAPIYPSVFCSIATGMEGMMRRTVLGIATTMAAMMLRLAGWRCLRRRNRPGRRSRDRTTG